MRRSRENDTSKRAALAHAERFANALQLDNAQRENLLTAIDSLHEYSRYRLEHSETIESAFYLLDALDCTEYKAILERAKSRAALELYQDYLFVTELSELACMCERSIRNMIASKTLQAFKNSNNVTSIAHEHAQAIIDKRMSKIQRTD